MRRRTDNERTNAWTAQNSNYGDDSDAEVERPSLDSSGRLLHACRVRAIRLDKELRACVLSDSLCCTHDMSPDIRTSPRASVKGVCPF